MSCQRLGNVKKQELTKDLLPVFSWTLVFALTLSTLIGCNVAVGVSDNSSFVGANNWTIQNDSWTPTSLSDLKKNHSGMPLPPNLNASAVSQLLIAGKVWRS